jgi:hypothetical protein
MPAAAAAANFAATANVGRLAQQLWWLLEKVISMGTLQHFVPL